MSKANIIRLLWLTSLLVLPCVVMMAMLTSTYDQLQQQLRSPDITPQQKVDIYNKLSYESIRANPDLIKLNADSALLLARSIQYDKGELEALKNIGNYYMKKGIHIDTAIVMYSAALEKAEELKEDFHISGLNNNIALLYRQEGKYEQALYHLLVARRVHKESIDSTTYLYGLIHTNLSETYLELGEIKEAKKYYDYLVDTLCTAPNMQKVKHMSIIGASYADYLLDGNISKAENRIQSNMADLKELDDQESMIKSYNTIIQIAMLEKDWPKALEVADKVYQNEEYITFTKEYCILLRNLSSVHAKLNNYDKVISIGQEARNCSPTYNTLDYKISIARELYQAYSSIGDTENADAELNMLSNYMDGLIQDQKKDIRLETIRKYESDLQEVENQMLIAKEKSQKTLVTYLRSALVIFILMTLLVGFFHFKKRLATKALKSQNQLLLDTQLTLSHKNQDLKKYIESNIQLEQFAHIASHDLKSPIRTIRSFIGLIQNRASTKLDSSENMYLSLVSDAADDMYALVNDLLEYSKANALDLTVSEVNLPALIENVTRQLSHEIEERGAKITTRNLPPTPMLVDEVKMRQVLQNLIGNALKFVPDDRMSQVEISYKSLSSGAHQIIISDNGIGINPEYYDDVFEPFKRLNTKQEYMGTGLGLSLVKRIVDKHDGKIWIEANEPCGTKFILEIHDQQEFKSIQHQHKRQVRA